MVRDAIRATLMGTVLSAGTIILGVKVFAVIFIRQVLRHATARIRWLVAVLPLTIRFIRRILNPMTSASSSARNFVVTINDPVDGGDADNATSIDDAGTLNRTYCIMCCWSHPLWRWQQDRSSRSFGVRGGGGSRTGSGQMNLMASHTSKRATASGTRWCTLIIQWRVTRSRFVRALRPCFSLLNIGFSALYRMMPFWWRAFGRHFFFSDRRRGAAAQRPDGP